MLAAAPAFAAGPAANTPVTVTGFSRAMLSVYDKQGNPLPAVAASGFKTPITSTSKSCIVWRWTEAMASLSAALQL